jgi:hypothetical protein
MLHPFFCINPHHHHLHPHYCLPASHVSCGAVHVLTFLPKLRWIFYYVTIIVPYRIIVQCRISWKTARFVCVQWSLPSKTHRNQRKRLWTTWSPWWRDICHVKVISFREQRAYSYKTWTTVHVSTTTRSNFVWSRREKSV